MGLFVLSKLQDLGINVGIYRDDGLATSSSTRRQIECTKKKIQSIFNKLGLQITIEPNQTKVNFLNITMDLENDIYKPYIKPNTTPLYIHSQSNHPPNIIKNLPSAINKRLSSTSCNEEEFEKAAPIFNEVLQKSGYRYKLKFDRRIDVTWFKPKREN